MQPISESLSDVRGRAGGCEFIILETQLVGL
jgi:hypothetical protein